mgnify:CR=1 FL=1
MVWPVHCEIGTWGHNVHAAVRQAYNAWEEACVGVVDKVFKGTNPWTEHYSAIRAEVPDPDDESTRVNARLITRLRAADMVLISGEAGSHCVKATTEHIVELRDTYRSVFQKQDGVKDNGEPNYVDDPSVKDSIGKAWKKYKGQAAKVDGKGFRAFVETDGESAEALRILNGVQELFAQIDRLGLSDFEASKPKESVIGRLLSPDTGTNEAARKIMRDAVRGEEIGAPADQPVALLGR